MRACTVTGVDAALVGSTKVGLQMTQLSREGEVSDREPSGMVKFSRAKAEPTTRFKLRPQARSLIKPGLVCRRPWT